MKKNNKSSNEKKAQSVAMVILTIMLILLVIGVTYAIFTYSKNGKAINQVTTATMTMNYVEGDNGLTIENAIPMEDSIGKTLIGDDEIFDFTIDVNMTPGQGLIYEIAAHKTEYPEEQAIKNEDVRLYLESSDTKGSGYTQEMAPTSFTPLESDTAIGSKKGEMLLATVGVTESKTTYYRLRMWVAKDFVLTGISKKFTVTINAYGKDTSQEDAKTLS